MGKSARNKQKSKNRPPQSQNRQSRPLEQLGQAPDSILGTGPGSTSQSGREDSASRNPSSDASWPPIRSPGIGSILERLSLDNLDELPGEQALEIMLLRVLEEIYLEAWLRLVDMGYDYDIAEKALLRNGHCYGDEDVLLNIFNNALSYLTADCHSRNPIFEADGIVITSWSHMLEHSLDCMVHVLQQNQHSRRMAMGSLLFSKLHMSLAIELLPSYGNFIADSSKKDATNVDLPPCCRFNRCLGIRWLRDSGVSSNRSAVGNERNNHKSNDEEHSLRDIEIPERFGLSPELKSMLKKNVPKIAAAVRTNSMHLLAQTFMPSSSSVKGDAPAVSQPEVCDEPSALANEERAAVDILCGRFSNLNLQGNLVDLSEDRKDAIILHLQNQIEDYEKQVKETEAWACQKAIQAEKRVYNAILELEMLRKEMAESHTLKKGKPTLEVSTVMKLSEKESTLRKMGAQAEATRAVMTRVENENDEIRAALEAFNLSAAESENAYLEISKREKKNLKKLLGYEKQKVELQEEIAEQKQKISHLQQQLVEREQAQREVEMKCKQAADAKELAYAQLKEEKQALEAAKADGKKRLEDLRLRTEIELKLYRDDVLRLEQELSHLKIVVGNTEATAELETLLPPRHVSDEQDRRKCIICRKNEVCVLFLPCAHEVMCADCSDKYGYKEKVLCPMCRVPIEKAIQAFGGSLK